MSEKWIGIWKWVEMGYSERSNVTSISIVEAIRMGTDIFGKGEGE